MSLSSPPTQEVLERFQALRQCIGKLEKGIKTLEHDSLEEPLKDARKLEEELAYCAESVKLLQFWMEDKIQEFDLAKLPFKVGDFVGWEERRNHGTRFEYRVFRTGTLFSIKRRVGNKWNESIRRHELVPAYDYVISLPGKSRKTCSSDRIDLLTKEDFEAAKKEYADSLEAVKSSFPPAKPKPKTKKAK
jgi:hypothetical protein